MHTITVANLKGGVAKTTTTVGLAACLSRVGGTLVVDLDSQRQAVSWARRAGGMFPPEAVAATAQSLADVLAERSDSHRWAVVDTPPGDVASVRAGMAAADAVVIPLSPTILDVERIGPTIRLLGEVEADGADRPFAALLVRARAGTRAVGEVRAALAGYGVPVLGPVVPLREGIAQGFRGRADLDAYLTPAQAIRELLETHP